jgi:YD repeat-containing protein
MRDSTGRATKTYDELSRMKTFTVPSAKRLTYTWDPLGQRASMIALTGGRVTCTYDAAQRISRVANPEVQRTTYACDTASRRSVKLLPSGARTTTVWDYENQPTLYNKLPTGARVTMSYNAGNRRIRMET